jgi:hypothetical protein
MTLGWTIVLALVVLGTISFMIKDEDFEDWDKNNDH